VKDPTIKSIYKDSIRNITFEVLNYFKMEQNQIHQALDEYYRRYGAPIPKDGSTVRIVCDHCGPRPPSKKKSTKLI